MAVAVGCGVGDDVAVAVGIGVSVLVGAGVGVDVLVGIRVLVAVGVGVSVTVPVAVGVLVLVLVGVLVVVLVDVGTAVDVLVDVGVLVDVEVEVDVAVGVDVDVDVGVVLPVGVGVAVLVGVAVGVADGAACASVMLGAAVAATTNNHSKEPKTPAIPASISNRLIHALGRLVSADAAARCSGTPNVAPWPCCYGLSAEPGPHSPTFYRGPLIAGSSSGCSTNALRSSLVASTQSALSGSNTPPLRTR